LDWPWRKRKVEGITLERLQSKAGFVLDIQGQKVVAIRLPATVAKEVAGQGAITPIGPAVGSGYESQTHQKWLIVTNTQAPLLRDYDDFVLLAAKGLTSACGSSVQSDDLIVLGVSAKIPPDGESLSPQQRKAQCDKLRTEIENVQADIEMYQSMLDSPLQPSDWQKKEHWKNCIDLLRSEENGLRQQFYELGCPGLAVTGPPPHPPLDVENWLFVRPQIRESIVWEPPVGAVKAYADWSSDMKETLSDAVHALANWQALGITDPPPLAITPSGNELTSGVIQTTLTEPHAWRIFIGHVAQSIAVEAFHRVPWSLNDLDTSELRLLFDGRLLFRWKPATTTYSIDSSVGGVTPGDPSMVFQFLRSNGLVGIDRRNAIERVLDWCRWNLVHWIGEGQTAEIAYTTWQYYGLPPVKRIIEGTLNPLWPVSTPKHWTAGCCGTTGFLRAVLRTVNIPVELVSPATHFQPHFVHENLYLSHGDDPYDGKVRDTTIPISRLPIDQTTFDAWFGPSVPDSDKANNVGRKTAELGVEYLCNYLLVRRCSDIFSGASHEESEVYKALSRCYTVQQLEAMDLWTNLDNKITAKGGCQNIHEFHL